MKYKIEVTFGVGVDRHQKFIPGGKVTSAIGRILREGSQRFGGCSISDNAGAWVNSLGVLVIENSKTVVCYTTGLMDDASVKRNAAELAQFCKDALNQESVLLAVNPCDWSFV